MGRAPPVKRLLPYDWTSQAPQSALLSLDRVSEVKGGRLGWWFLERSREKDERLGGSAGGEVWRSPLGSGQTAPPRRSPTSRRAACRGEDLLRWNSVDEAVDRSGSHPAFPLSLLVWLPPFWVRWRGHHGFPPFPSLLFVPKLPKTDLEGWRVGRAPWKG